MFFVIISIKIYKDLQLHKRDMIEGVELDKIEQADFYRRFIVLRLLLGKAISAKERLSEQGSNRYEQIHEELHKLEELIAIKNINYNAKAHDTTLRLDELNEKLTAIMPQVQEKKSMFESQLLKRWRNILTLKKEHEQQSQKEKDDKRTSNKNLMYLAAELLKKERISTHNLCEHRDKISRIQQKVENTIIQSSKDFNRKHADLKGAISLEKRKANQMIQNFKQSLASQKQQFIEQIHMATQRIKQKLDQENAQNSQNFDNLKNIFLQLQQRESRS